MASVPVRLRVSGWQTERAGQTELWVYPAGCQGSHIPALQPNRQCLLAAGFVTDGPIHSQGSWVAGASQRPVPLLTKYIRHPQPSAACMRQLDSAAFYPG